MTTTDKIHQTLRDSAGMRWLVLLLLAFAMFCSYIFMDILSPIKDLMQSTRGWDSTAFGTMQGSETFLNVFVFFLIFAGIILDKMGVRFTAILSRPLNHLTIPRDTVIPAISTPQPKIMKPIAANFADAGIPL